MILKDWALEARAAVRPCDRGDLAAIKGVGPAKLEAYCEDLLRVLAGPPGSDKLQPP